ncbi:MAG: hypothetical protein BJ554DRAFT_4271, partial [Olpidium bornovanus]
KKKKKKKGQTNKKPKRRHRTDGKKPRQKKNPHSQPCPKPPPFPHSGAKRSRAVRFSRRAGQGKRERVCAKAKTQVSKSLRFRRRVLDGKDLLIGSRRSRQPFCRAGHKGFANRRGYVYAVSAPV